MRKIAIYNTKQNKTKHQFKVTVTIRHANMIGSGNITFKITPIIVPPTNIGSNINIVAKSGNGRCSRNIKDDVHENSLLNLQYYHQKLLLVIKQQQILFLNPILK